MVFVRVQIKVFQIKLMSRSKQHRGHGWGYFVVPGYFHRLLITMILVAIKVAGYLFT